jgi:hypothetical protein
VFVGALPIAVQAVGELHDTSVSFAGPGGARGVWVDQPVPFHTSIKVCQGGAPLVDG